MPSKILTDLAPELLIQILKSSDSFEDVTSLGSTSRKMFVIWKTNLDVICDTILARIVPCYAQARELVEAQEKAEGDEHYIFGYLSAVDRVQWMLKGADNVTKALAYFDEHVLFSTGEWALTGVELVEPSRTDGLHSGFLPRDYISNGRERFTT